MGGGHGFFAFFLLSNFVHFFDVLQQKLDHQFSVANRFARAGEGEVDKAMLKSYAVVFFSKKLTKWFKKIQPIFLS